MALVFVAKDGENSIAVASGANGRLSPADVKRARKAIASAAVVVMQLETPLPTVIAAADIAAKAGTGVILNPAPAQPLPDELLRLVSILTPNETEAELLTGIRVHDEQSAGHACRGCSAHGVQAVIITLGPRGAFVATAGLRKLVRGFKMRAVNATAAGNVFNGGLAVALAEGRTLEHAVRFANAAAAISVTRLGRSHRRRHARRSISSRVPQRNVASNERDIFRLRTYPKTRRCGVPPHYLSGGTPLLRASRRVFG